MTDRDFAMEVDRRGRDFYREMARRADSAAARGVLERLAEDAERLIEKHGRLETTGVEVDAALLKDEQEIFRRHRQTVPADEVGAYRLALAVEGEVCRLFEGAAAQERDILARQVLRQVAASECAGRQELEAVCDFVNAPNEFLAWSEFSNLDEFHNFGRYEDNRSCRHTS